MNKAAVLFDLDGTLIDTAADFVRIIKVMCAKHHHPCPSDEAIREQVSAGSKAMVRLMFGELANSVDDDPKLLAYRQEFLDLYEADICVDSQVFTGLQPLLTTLESHNIAWGIVTNKPRYLAEKLLEKLNLTHRCAVLVCPDDVTHTKPDPEPMLLAMDRLSAKFGQKFDPAWCLYIGDHIRDIQAGRAAGMMTVVAKFGYLSAQDKQNLPQWGADLVVDTPQELTAFILTHFNLTVAE